MSTAEHAPWWSVRPAVVGVAALALALGGAILSMSLSEASGTVLAAAAGMLLASLGSAASALRRERSAAVSGTAGAAGGIVVTVVGHALVPSLASRPAASALLAILVAAVVFGRWLSRHGVDVPRPDREREDRERHALRNALFTVDAATRTLARRHADLSPEVAAELAATASRGVDDLRSLILERSGVDHSTSRRLGAVADAG